jgi:hypothetical protein
VPHADVPHPSQSLTAALPGHPRVALRAARLLQDVRRHRAELCPSRRRIVRRLVVPKPGKVVYLAAEGVSGLETRILAWCEVWDVDPPVLRDRLFVLPLPIQLGNQVEVSQAVAVVAEVQADLLVLDTRAR